MAASNDVRDGQHKGYARETILRRLTAAAAAFAIAALAACGGDDHPGVTTIPSTTALNTLSTTQLTQLCADTQAYEIASISSADRCKAKGITHAEAAFGAEGASTDSAVQSDCTAASESACMDVPLAECITGDTTTCAGTERIEQYSACATDRIAATRQLIESWPSCDMLTATDLMTLEQTAPLPASCQAFQTACPDVILPGG